MKLPTAEEMARLDKRCIEELKLLGLILMENAGLGVVQNLYKHYPRLSDMRVGVLAGRGNNGGDGLVVARHLHQRGVNCQVFLLARPEELRGDAKTNLTAFTNSRGKLSVVPDARAFKKHYSDLIHCQLLVDGILGTGLRTDVTGFYARVIEEVNKLDKPVVAIDVPSGVNATSGKVMGAAIKAGVTVTLGLPKLGLVIHPGLDYVGKLEVHDIGIPAFVVEEAEIKADLIDQDEIRGYFSARAADTHKGDYGRLGIIAGSPGMTGAASLACLGALRVGAGLITLAVSRSLNPVMEVKLTEVMTSPLEDTPGGWLAPAAFKDIEKLWSRFSALVLGPGILPNADTLELMAKVIEKSPVPLAIDAGGLDAIAAQPELLGKAGVSLVLTPHPGEMARILGVSPEEVQQDRVGIARDYAKRNGVTLVLKGSRTVVATASGQIYINPSGNPGMASGGMGDVLIGMIGGFLAQGLAPDAAALAAVYLHGLAGDKAGEEKGQRALIASDLLDKLPGLIRGLEDSAAGYQSS